MINEIREEDYGKYFVRIKGLGNKELVQKFLDSPAPGEEEERVYVTKKEFEKEMGGRNYERALDRQDIKMLKDYLELKENNKRNDYAILSVKLRKELMGRPHGMLTRDVKEHFGLNQGTQARRLMERTEKDFLIDIILQKERGKNKSWWIKARASTGRI